MTYYEYRIEHEDRVSKFFGAEKQDIIDTIRYYNERGEKLHVPDENEIKKLEGKCVINCSKYGGRADHIFNIDLEHDIRFVINANAVNDISDLVERFEKLKRGRLYKFPTGNPVIFGNCFFPEEVMKGLKARKIKQTYGEKARRLLDAHNRVC